MSALAQFLPQKRAPRIVRPYRPDCQPTRGEIEHEKQYLLRQRPSATDPQSLLQFAHDMGFIRGISDRHYERLNFSTGAEWLSWLKGWREGQEQFKANHAREATAQHARETEFLQELEKECP